MRQPFPILALLALAAASSAQTVVLSPVALSGYQRTTASGRNGTSSYILTSGLVTAAAYEPGPNNLLLTGWRAEFDLSAVPTGASILSATFATEITARGGSSEAESLFLSSYRGSGAISAQVPSETASTALPAGLPVGAPTPIDVASLLQRTPGRYFGLDVLDSGQFSRSRGTTTDSWASPTLTLTYAPVPEPAPLAALGMGALALLRCRRA